MIAIHRTMHLIGCVCSNAVVWTTLVDWSSYLPQTGTYVLRCSKFIMSSMIVLRKIRNSSIKSCINSLESSIYCTIDIFHTMMNPWMKQNFVIKVKKGFNQSVVGVCAKLTLHSLKIIARRMLRNRCFFILKTFSPKSSLHCLLFFPCSWYREKYIFLWFILLWSNSETFLSYFLHEATRKIEKQFTRIQPCTLAVVVQPVMG